MCAGVPFDFSHSFLAKDVLQISPKLGARVEHEQPKHRLAWCHFNQGAGQSCPMPRTIRLRGGSSMNLRFMCFLAACLAISSPALADEQPGLLRRMSCSMVRFYIAKYSAPAAEQWARSKG